MSHTLNYNPELRMIESKVIGELTLNEVRETITQYAVICKEKGCTLLLNDFREATIQLSTAEIYSLPQMIMEIYAASGVNIHPLRRALVAAKDLDDYLFFETVTVNRGQDARVFYDIDEARRWLLAK
jgi:hypothetical protein